ncbi:MAG: NUDIX hydrolase [SAR324 cluster bacterium]|uniref:NUDIX hydrolase n=1 Tax=SAR324 cluster bacterium TaxID=2024889 RepID=A0A2A4T5T3_9DELT|nr:MAG: NUDIX hydrolase [SAR324 cluster bacterium]
MHRVPLIQLVKDFQPQTHIQEKREQILSFIQAHPDCCERSLLPGHLTGSAWVVNHDGSHVLVNHHKKLNKWIQLGGHADGEPNLLAVAWREAREESGIPDLRPFSREVFDLDIYYIPPSKSAPAHYHYDICFAFQTVSTEEYQISDESYDLNWFKIDRLQEQGVEESILRMQASWQEFAFVPNN